MPNYINRSTRPFNAPGQLFDGSEKPHFNFIKEMQAALPPNPVDLVPDGTRNRINFDESQPVTQRAPAQAHVLRDTYVGNFSAVRAARILHQHQIDFWNRADIQAILNNPAPPLYSTDILTQMYADFKLFNYLPTSMTPSFEAFVDMVNGVPNPDELVGITVPVPTTPDGPDNTILIPVNPPFGESLSPFCDQIKGL